MLAVEEPSDGETSEQFRQAVKWRERIKERLEEEDATDLCDKISRCGRKFLLHCTNCGRIHETESRCNLKWCPVCSRKRATRLSMKYRKASALMKWPMHVTLTRSNVANIDADCIRGLIRAFKDLRRRRIFTLNVVGGIKSVELTNTGKGWHPHLHTLLDCEWLAIRTRKPAWKDSRGRKKELCQLASQELHDEWCSCVGQLMASLKVRRCEGDTAVAEVLKYCVKGDDLAESPDTIAEAIRAISAGRLVSAFGSLYNLRSQFREEERPSFPCPACGVVKAWMPEEAVSAMMGKSRRDRRRR